MRKVNFEFIKQLIVPHVLHIPAAQFIGLDQEPTSAGIWNSQLISQPASFADTPTYYPAAVSGTSATLTVLPGSFNLLTAGSATTITLDSAYNVAKNLPGYSVGALGVGQTFVFAIGTNASTTVATPTIRGDTTLAGTTSVSANAVRYYQGSLTQVSTTTTFAPTAGTTVTSLTQVGSTNLFTLAISGNSVTATAGNLVYIASNAGTLPVGWYPIATASSTSSLIIATPPGTVWTVSSATIGSTAPTTAQYAPLITVTGLYQIAGTVTA